jgi:DNA-binding response OmpR family regulator
VTIPFIFLTAKGEKPDIRAGMNLGADDYLTKPVGKADLLAAIRSRLERAVQQAIPEFKPNFHSAKPLEEVLGLTPRVAEFPGTPPRKQVDWSESIDFDIPPLIVGTPYQRELPRL